MAKILLSFGNAVLSEHNPHALPCFYESFAKSLVNVGNEVLIWHSFGPSQAIASAHQEKIIAGIKDFSPELIVAFNNYGLNWAKWFDCPILIYEVDSPLYYENVRAIREHPDRYKYIVCQETSRDILTKQLNVPKSFVDIAPFFTEVQAHELPIERNIAFIGSRFVELTFHWQRYLNSKEKYLPEFRRRYVSALNYIRKNVFADAEDIIAKFSDLSLTREDVDDILPSLSAEKRIEVLTIIADLGLEIFGNANWLLGGGENAEFFCSYNPKRVYSLKHNQDIYNSSKLCININHLQAVDGFSWRVCDAMASSACLVSEWTPGFNKYFPTVPMPTFKDKFEAYRLCKDLIENDARRKEIVSASQEAIERGFRFRHILPIIEHASGIKLTSDIQGSIDFIDGASTFNDVKQKSKSSLAVNGIKLALSQLPVFNKVFDYEKIVKKIQRFHYGKICNSIINS